MTNIIEIGDKVTRIFAWSADKTPSDKNFHIGTVLEVLMQGRYFRISGLESLAPADRVQLIEKGNVKAFPKFIYLNEAVSRKIYDRAVRNGFRACVTATNFDRDEFEVTSDASHIAKIRFADTSDDCFGNCDCMDFKVRHHICKHLAFIAVEEIYTVLEERKVA